MQRDQSNTSYVSMLKVFPGLVSFITTIFAIIIFFVIDFSSVFGKSPQILSDVEAVTCRSDVCPDIPEIYSITIFNIESKIEGTLHLENYDARTWLSIGGDMIVEFDSTTSNGLVSLGDVLTYYGVPCWVIITEDSINFQYPDFYMVTSADYDLRNPETLNVPLSIYMPIQLIRSTPGNCDTPLIFPASFNIISEWNGLMTVGEYFAEYNANRHLR